MSAPSVLRVGRPPPRPSSQAKLEELGAANVLCVLSTTSCFAPRAVEKLLPIGRLCRDADVPHIANNAYGVQCAACMKAIAAASRHGRLDAFVQSTDKNFLVPVGGAIVATASKDHGGPLLKTIKATYPGRASISPVLDLFTTLLHLGASGWARLLSDRREKFAEFRERLGSLAAAHGERLLATPNNGISMGVTLTHAGGAPPAELGANLFIRLISGVKVVAPSDTPKTLCGVTFKSYGSHEECPRGAYFSAACALGITATDMDRFFDVLDGALRQWKAATRQPALEATLGAIDIAGGAGPGAGVGDDTSSSAPPTEAGPEGARR